jgi:hypothetical protein
VAATGFGCYYANAAAAAMGTKTLAGVPRAAARGFASVFVKPHRERELPKRGAEVAGCWRRDENAS